MKNVWKIALAASLSAALFLTGCGGGGGSDEGSSGSADGDTIKIGVNYELSGATATYGSSSVEGIDLAIKQINEAGGVLGKQIELVEGDNKSEPAEATSLSTKLMTNDGVVAVLGPATTGNFKATIPVADKNQIPVISGSATADDVTVDLDDDGNPTEVKEFAFKICFSDSFQGITMANFASSNLGATKAVIIMDNSNDYGIGLAKNFRSTFESLGGEIVGEEAYIAGNTDFSGILTKIRSMDFDVIFLPGYYSEAGLIIKQARDLGITAPVLGADGFDSPTLLDLAGASALNDVYYSNHYSSLDEDPAVIQFIEDFNAEYGKDPDAFNALGYDTAKFLCDAIERAGEADPIAIKDALASTESFAGVTGTFSIDENHNPVKSVVVIKLTDGEPSESIKI